MKAIELCRLSTKEQNMEGRTGLQRQKEVNANTIKRNNLSIVKSYNIIDVSGTSVLQAHEVQELLLLIRSDEIKGVVVANLDRLLRLDNFEDFALLQKFKESNTLIILPDQIIDLNTQSGFLIGGMQSIISGNELTLIKERMQGGKESKRRNGQHPNGTITLPTGVNYDYVKKQFFYNNDAYRIKRLFDLFYTDGIHNYNELQKITGFHHRTIPNLLKNEIYIGYRTYTEKRGPEKRVKPDGRQGDRRKVKRSPDEIIRVKVINEPLINEDVFRDVQTIIYNKNYKYHQNRSEDGERFLYTGFLTCGECGEIMYTTSGGRNHKKDYYYCRTKNTIFIRHNGKLNCSSSYLQKELVEHLVTSFISEQITDKNYLKALINVALSQEISTKKQHECQTLQEKMKKLRKKRSKMLDLYGDDLFSREELDQKVHQLNSEITSIENQVDRLRREMLAKNDIIIEHSIEVITTTLVEFRYWTPRQKRLFLRSQLSELRITKEGITELTLTFCKERNRSRAATCPTPSTSAAAAFSRFTATEPGFPGRCLTGLTSTWTYRPSPTKIWPPLEARNLQALSGSGSTMPVRSKPTASSDLSSIATPRWEAATSNASAVSATTRSVFWKPPSTSWACLPALTAAF